MSFLQQAVDDLLAVLAEIGEYKRYMYPARTGLGILLPDELIEGQVVLDVIEPLAAFLNVAVDAEISGLSFHVLRVVDTTDGFVQGLAAKA